MRTYLRHFLKLTLFTARHTGTDLPLIIPYSHFSVAARHLLYARHVCVRTYITIASFPIKGEVITWISVVPTPRAHSTEAHGSRGQSACARSKLRFSRSRWNFRPANGSEGWGEGGGESEVDAQKEKGKRDGFCKGMETYRRNGAGDVLRG